MDIYVVVLNLIVYHWSEINKFTTGRKGSP